MLKLYNLTHLLLVLLNLGALKVRVCFVIGCHEAEREALFKFKHSLSVVNSLLESWEGKDCCQWEGVGCHNVTTYVNSLKLRNLNWDYDFNEMFISAPTLDASLLELRHLNYLDLSGNDFQGSQIPGFLGSFKHLRYLNLSYSNFGGVVPSQLGNLTILHTLNLSTSVSYFTPRFLSSNLYWVSTLVSLQYLNLDGILISPIRDSMYYSLNRPSLLGLGLSYCGLSTPHFLSLFSNSTCLSQIQQLDLSHNLLEGPLPHVIANMTSLRYLSLAHNNLNGSIPLSLRNMRKREHLDLSYNNFSRVEEGAVMGILGNLCKLKTFSLSHNPIGGEIGTHRNFSNCSTYNLEILQLRRNLIGSTLPYWLGDFKKLRMLDISNNEISGRIPLSIGSLSSLEELDLSDNSLNGTIPEVLGQCKALVSIDLSSNSLQGAVSESHLSNLLRLNYLDLSFNPLDLNLTSNWSPPFQLGELHMKSCKVQTQFPQWITKQTNLTVLDLSDNSMSGTLVQWFPNNILLEVNISHNQITGPVPYFSALYLNSLDLSYNLLSGKLLHDGSSSKNDLVGTPLCQLPSLQFLDLQNNNIVGTIPDCWGSSDYLAYINLSSNNLSGFIPMSMGLLPFLGFLKLSNNSLQGPIPPTLSTSSSLQILDLGENKLVGSIPSHYPSLEMLLLRGNQFVGAIPPILCSLSKLQFLDLAHNNLTGSIPPCFGHLISMKSSSPQHHNVFYADNPFYAGPPIAAGEPSDSFTEPREDSTTVVLKGAELQYTTTLKFVVNLDLSCNALTGSIPEEMTNLSSLIGLNLSNNHLTGNIPKKIGEMRLLESLDLSNNNLSGTIPSSMSSLTSLIALNLSYNKLHGQIPTGQQLQVIKDPLTSYVGNPGLCGDPLPNKCETSPVQNQPQEEEEKKDDKKDNWENPLFYFVIFSGFATGFWVVVGSLLLKTRFRFALFQLVDRITDYFYVQVMVRINRIRN
ncbi:receptor-like protein EIX1 [Silene latifolia]|uniref:receptor-like protein EIX1 n=1 Tax=Silene latifolia TaxID=37657 RepID=UPI003D77FF49